MQPNPTPNNLQNVNPTNPQSSSLVQGAQHPELSASQVQQISPQANLTLTHEGQPRQGSPDPRVASVEQPTTAKNVDIIDLDDSPNQVDNDAPASNGQQNSSIVNIQSENAAIQQNTITQTQHVHAPQSHVEAQLQITRMETSIEHPANIVSHTVLDQVHLSTHVELDQQSNQQPHPETPVEVIQIAQNSTPVFQAQSHPPQSHELKSSNMNEIIIPAHDELMENCQNNVQNSEMVQESKQNQFDQHGHHHFRQNIEVVNLDDSAMVDVGQPLPSQQLNFNQEVSQQPIENLPQQNTQHQNIMNHPQIIPLQCSQTQSHQIEVSVQETAQQVIQDQSIQNTQQQPNENLVVSQVIQQQVAHLSIDSHQITNDQQTLNNQSQSQQQQQALLQSQQQPQSQQQSQPSVQQPAASTQQAQFAALASDDLTDINEIRQLLYKYFPPHLKQLTQNLADQELRQMYLQIREEQRKTAASVSQAQSQIQNKPQNQPSPPKPKQPQQLTPPVAPQAQPQKKKQAPKPPSSTPSHSHSHSQSQPQPQPVKKIRPTEQSQHQPMNQQAPKRVRKQRKRVVTTVVQQVQYYDESDNDVPTKYQVMENGDLKKKKVYSNGEKNSANNKIQMQNILGQLCGLIKGLDLSALSNN